MTPAVWMAGALIGALVIGCGVLAFGFWFDRRLRADHLDGGGDA